MWIWSVATETRAKFIESIVLQDVIMDTQCDMCVILALLVVLGVILFSFMEVVPSCTYTHSVHAKLVMKSTFSESTFIMMS